MITPWVYQHATTHFLHVIQKRKTIKACVSYLRRKAAPLLLNVDMTTLMSSRLWGASTACTLASYSVVQVKYVSYLSIYCVSGSPQRDTHIDRLEYKFIVVIYMDLTRSR